MKAVFPYSGAKAGIADRVWAALGDPKLYVEPFAGSAGVLLARPHAAGYEVVNDSDARIMNAYRAIKRAPDELAAALDFPPAQVELLARANRLRSRYLVERLQADPDAFDLDAAADFIYCACLTVGPIRRIETTAPSLYGGEGGRGVFRSAVSETQTGKPITGADRQAAMRDYLRAIGQRLNRAELLCGDRTAALRPARLKAACDGVIGVFLDPPYSTGRDSGETYAAGTRKDIAGEVAAWACAHGRDPQYRIALCGHPDDHALPDWRAIEWNQSGYRRERSRGECLWLSPYCLSEEGMLF